ncbi:MAG TPA: HIT family protein [Bacteroidales bacterium]|nr:HIT family protein [Bacteroidales bacterium]
MEGPDELQCPFCTAEFTESAFLADNNFVAVYNIAPILPGHSLVVPRRHAESLMDLSANEVSGFFGFAREATRQLLKAFNGDGFDWSLQEKESAGQTVAHLHLHIVIRRKGDLEETGDWYPLVEQSENTLLDSFSRKKLDNEEYRLITNRLRKMVSGGKNL